MKLYVPFRVEGSNLGPYGTFSSERKALRYVFEIVEAEDLSRHNKLYPEEEYEYNSADLWDYISDVFSIILVDTDRVS
tara:strand:+ start:317 stop:550 length:234 start_codon:yes stop_codon:yes gene_type:complete